MAAPRAAQQSAYISPGTDDDNSVWAVDGVVITDMGAIGSSPSYYNFDAFEEMQVTTGGTDVSLATGGVTMNMVTKRGTNEWRASGRYLVTDGGWQDSPSIDSGDLAAGQTGVAGNTIVDVVDYGAELGGPILKDALWIWGSYGVQEVDLRTFTGDPDFTELESYAVKLNGQLGASNSLVVFYHYGDKIKIGRNASPARPAPTTWNQSGPTDIYKLEDSHIFSSSFYLTGMGSYVGGGFQLIPQGGGIGSGLETDNIYRTPAVVWQNSFFQYQTDRPQNQYKVDGSYFFNTGGASHELRFGVGYREAEVSSLTSYPGTQLVALQDFSFGPNNGPPYYAWSATEGVANDEVEYTSAYAQDTFTLGNLTVNAGLRYDLQEGTNLPGTVKPAIVTQGLLTGGTFAGGDPGFEWESLEPRLGLTYALGEERETLLRASYSRFADQLGSGNVAFTSGLGFQYGYAFWYDDGDNVLENSELGAFFSFAGNIDPFNSANGLTNLNRVDPSLDAPTTQEFIASIEHALLPEFVVGVTGTWRNYFDILEFERLVCDLTVNPNGCAGGQGLRLHQRSDYALLGPVAAEPYTLPDGSQGTSQIYGAAPNIAFSGFTQMENGDREQDYLGVSLTFNKRLANRWLLRGHVTFSEWEWDIPESEREDPSLVSPGNNIDGGAVLLGSGTSSGAKGDVFINSNWSFDISGMYQIAPDRPWGFNVAANVNGREGYPVPYTDNRFVGGIGNRGALLVEDVEQFRNDDLYIVNARLEKEFNFSDIGLTVGADIFNLFDENTVIQRENRLDAAISSTNPNGPDFVSETTQPRIIRLGFRISFK